MDAPACFIGIDVSKARLDGCCRPQDVAWHHPNHPAGIADWVARLRAWGPALVVREATGGYEIPTAAALAAAGTPTAVVNPRPARDCAKAIGQLAKNDRIDAAVLASFAEAVRPVPRPLPDAAIRSLDALRTRRRQLLEMRTMEPNRLGSCTDAAVRADLQTPIAWRSERLRHSEPELQAAVRASPAWREKDELLRRIKGIGPGASPTLRAALPERGTVTNQQAAALAGLAP